MSHHEHQQLSCGLVRLDMGMWNARATHYYRQDKEPPHQETPTPPPMCTYTHVNLYSSKRTRNSKTLQLHLNWMENGEGKYFFSFTRALPPPETRVSSLAPVDLPCLSEVLDTGMTNQSTPGDILWETLRAMLDMELPSPQPSSGGPAELPSPLTTPPLYKIPQIP